MRFFYADPFLRNAQGDRACTCRLLTQAFRQRHFDAVVLASEQLEDSIQSELTAAPFFTSERERSPDTISGWLDDFYADAIVVAGDMARLKGFTNCDILYLNVSAPAHLWGACRWAASVPSDHLARLVFALDADSGAELREEENDLLLGIPDSSFDPRPVLYHFAARYRRAGLLKGLRLATHSPQASEIYTTLLDVKVDQLPPLEADSAEKVTAAIEALVRRDVPNA